MRFIEAVKRANRPGEPENSIALRIACGASVLVGISACYAEGELAPELAVVAGVAVCSGMVFSYQTRTRPRQWTKPILSVAALLACVEFFRSLTSQTVYDLAGVENPLAALFAWIQVVHSFDVPSRRDLAFSLAGSTTLMVVAAAQATDLRFAPFALAWAGFGVYGLVHMWSSESLGGRMRPSELAGALVATVLASFAVLVVLPAPHVAGRIDFPASAAGGAVVNSPGGLVGDNGSAASEPSRPGSPAGASRVGGFLGFADRLDTALGPASGSEVVMRVRAQRPSYWIGETFDDFDGVSWSTSDSPVELPAGSPFYLPPTIDDPVPVGAAAVDSDLQTFYIVQTSPNLVFHADEADEVWFPVRDLFTRSDDSIVSPIALGPGAIYTVDSEVERIAVTAAEPRARPRSAQVRRSVRATSRRCTPIFNCRSATQRSRRWRARSPLVTVRATARCSPSSPGSAHTRSTRPTSRRCRRAPTPSMSFYSVTGSVFAHRSRRHYGSDAPNGRRRVPAREAVGYVPGSYNPITDLYDIQAKDAHAWVQVWFPGYGWQSFDPTAVVPIALPTPRRAQRSAHEASPTSSARFRRSRLPRSSAAAASSRSPRGVGVADRRAGPKPCHEGSSAAAPGRDHGPRRGRARP